MKKTENIITSNTDLWHTLSIADKNDKSIFLISDGDLIGYITDNKIRELSIHTENLNKKIINFVLNDFYVLEDINNASEIELKHPNYKLIVWKDKKEIKKIYGPAINYPKYKLENIPVVIMAGGKGVRMQPYTNIIPKPLIPIGDKPIIEIIINNFLRYNIKDFYLTLNYKSPLIKAFFTHLEKDYNVYFVDEKFPLGTIGGLKFLENTFDQPFFVSNCDIILKTSYTKLYDFHLRNNFDITLVGVVKKLQIPYGVCEVNGNMELVDFKEKPYNFEIINAGFYVINPQLIKLIPNNKKFDIGDFLKAIKHEGGRIGVYPIAEENWIDIGTLDRFEKNISRLR